MLKKKPGTSIFDSNSWNNYELWYMQTYRFTRNHLISQSIDTFAKYQGFHKSYPMQCMIFPIRNGSGKFQWNIGAGGFNPHSSKSSWSDPHSVQQNLITISLSTTTHGFFAKTVQILCYRARVTASYPYHDTRFRFSVNPFPWAVKICTCLS